MKTQMEDVVAISQEAVHAFFDGDMGPYISRLCSKSVHMGNGDRVLIGDSAIRSYLDRVMQHHMDAVLRKNTYKIIREDYIPFTLSSVVQGVMVKVSAAPSGQDQGGIYATYMLIYQLIGKSTKLVAVDANYESRHPFGINPESPVQEITAYQFLRDVLLRSPAKHRICVPCKSAMMFLQPEMILYIHSKDRKAEFICVDKVVKSSLSINEVNDLLPENFYPIHRTYTVNTQYVTSIERSKVTLLTGEELPIPFHAYMQVKTDLERMIGG